MTSGSRDRMRRAATRPCRGALGPRLISGTLPYPGGLEAARAFRGLSLSSTLAVQLSCHLGKKGAII